VQLNGYRLREQIFKHGRTFYRPREDGTAKILVAETRNEPISFYVSPRIHQRIKLLEREFSRQIQIKITDISEYVIDKAPNMVFLNEDLIP
jgi:hypothetical protein